MIEYADLAQKVFSLLKGNGLKIKIFDQDGSETTDPTAGRRFFVMNPNIMVTIDEEANKIEFSKGSTVGDDMLALQKNVRRLASEFQMNCDIKVFGKQIQPKDYAYQAKMGKETPMMENEMKPHNHHLVGEVLKMIKAWKGIHEYDLANNLGLTDYDALRPVLNHLVKAGKIQAERDPHGEIMYSMAMDEAVMEGFSKMFGSQKTSQQTLENVRILVRHKTPVDENVKGARTRQISAIFLECNGERFRFPYNYLPGARAMAQHMAHGGIMGDKVGSYITENVGHMLKLQSFNRYVTTNKLINESSSSIIDTVKENIETIRTELRKLTGVKTYETVKARLETFERNTLVEGDVSDLKELFTIKRFDEKFEEVLPIVKQLIQEKDTYHKRIEEAAEKVIWVRPGKINTTPMFEFASEHARLGFMVSELSSHIVENDELAGFISKIGTKLCKEGVVNNFERAVMERVFENLVVEGEKPAKQEVKEAVDLEAYFDRFDYKFV